MRWFEEGGHVKICEYLELDEAAVVEKAREIYHTSPHRPTWLRKVV
jgi:hypothetical protein